jgi:ketosteroid isomerase-like protein
MKHLKVISLLLFGTLFMTLNLVAQSEKDMKAIKEVVKQYENALNSNSLDGIVEVFDVDAVVLPPNAPAVTGHAGIREQYKRVTDPGTSIDITLEIQELMVSDYVAYVWSLNYGKIKFADSAESSIDSKSLMVLQKTMDGWKAHWYMFNGNDAPE